MMMPAPQPLLTFWLGRCPLAAPTMTVQQVLPGRALVPRETPWPAELLGTLPGESGRIPVVEGSLALGLASAAQEAQLLVLREMRLAVAVTAVGQVITPDVAARRALPPWLARQSAQQGIIEVVELDTLWFIIHWSRSPLARWLERGRPQTHIVSEEGEQRE